MNALATSHSPLAAVVLSSLCPGLGHIHNGYVRRGLVWLLPTLALAPVVAAVSGQALDSGRFVILAASACAAVVLSLGSIVDAVRVARRPRRRSPLPAAIYATLIAAGLAAPAGTSWSIDSFAFRAFVTVESSMEPTLLPGDRFLVNRARTQPPRWGELVVFPSPNDPDQLWIKRIVGMPGDVVEVRAGQLVVNGVVCGLPGAGSPSTSAGPEGPQTMGSVGQSNAHVAFPATEIPAGACFVVGDALRRSLDSRSFGPILLDAIVGRADYLFWPAHGFGRAGPLPGWSRPER